MELTQVAFEGQTRESEHSLMSKHQDRPSPAKPDAQTQWRPESTALLLPLLLTLLLLPLLLLVPLSLPRCVDFGGKHFASLWQSLAFEQSVMPEKRG